MEVQGYTVLNTVDPHEAFSLGRTVLDYRLGIHPAASLVVTTWWLSPATRTGLCSVR